MIDAVFSKYKGGPSLSIQELIQTLKEMMGYHKELLHASKEKTESLKDGDMNELQRILAKERKLVRKIEEVEKTRQAIVEKWIELHGHDDLEATITQILEKIEDDGERAELEQTVIELTTTLTELKAQEKLNLDLLNQSMQFVQLSLDLLNPSLKSMNYTEKNRQVSDAPNHSIFDSKA